MHTHTPSEVSTSDNSTLSILRLASDYGVVHKLPYAGAVTPTQAWTLVQAKAAAIVDVRSRYEHEFVGRIPDTRLIEWRLYENGTDGKISSAPNPAFMAALSQHYPADAVLLFLCRSAVRSHNAAIAAAEAGYTKVYNILEGFEGDKDASEQRGTQGGWRKAGLPWVQG